MNTQKKHRILILAGLALVAGLAGCGTARTPSASEGTDRIVAAAPVANRGTGLAEIVVVASRLPPEGSAGKNVLAEVVVRADRLPAEGSAGRHELPEVVVRADRLPADADQAQVGEARVAALLD